MSNFQVLQADGSNLSGFTQRMLIDDLVALSVVADELEEDRDIIRAVQAIRAIVGDETAGLWQAIGQLTSKADEWLSNQQAQTPNNSLEAMQAEVSSRKAGQSS